MPIIIPREGALPSATDVLTQAQKDMLWGSIVKNWVQKHPEELRSIMNEAKKDE